jgi:hypothetical protein
VKRVLCGPVLPNYHTIAFQRGSTSALVFRSRQELALYVSTRSEPELGAFERDLGIEPSRNRGVRGASAARN